MPQRHMSGASERQSAFVRDLAAVRATASACRSAPPRSRSGSPPPTVRGLVGGPRHVTPRAANELFGNVEGLCGDSEPCKPRRAGTDGADRSCCRDGEATEQAAQPPLLDMLVKGGSLCA